MLLLHDMIYIDFTLIIKKTVYKKFYQTCIKILKSWNNNFKLENILISNFFSKYEIYLG